VRSNPRITDKAPRGALSVWGRVGLLVLWLASSLPAGAGSTELASVRYVIDGDTVVLSDERTIRLIGINAPELGHGEAPDEPFATAARDRLRELVQGRPVRLEFEEEPRDRYGRWLAHLRLMGGPSVEEQLLAEGLACMVAIPPNVREAPRLQAVEATARRSRLGLWGHPYSVPLEVTAHLPAPGFHFVRGRVSRVGKSQKYIYFDLTPTFAVRIRHTDWEQYFRGRPESWQGKSLVARGWVSEHGDRRSLGIGHPAMIERLP